MDNSNNPLPQQPQYQQQQQQQPAQYQQPPAQYQQPEQQQAQYQQPTVPTQSYAAPPAPQAQNPGQYGLRVTDSLTANEFHVEINGQIVTGIFAINGLTSFQLEVDETGKPVAVKRPSIVLTKMVQQDPNLPFNAWVREAVQAQGKVLPTREISVVAMDEGVETRRWVLHNAWISQVQFSDFDTALDYLVEEKVTIQHGGIEEIWPNT